MMTKKSKVQFALEALEDVKKKLEMKKVRDDTYNLGTLTEVKASVFAITLEVDVVNSEWDNLSEDYLIKLLHVRFRDELEYRFDKVKNEYGKS